MTAPVKAVFFDRDGTLIHEKPGTYLSDPAKVRPYKSVAAALALLKKAGYKFFIVSNQSGIGRGYFTEKEVNAVHARMLKRLKPAVIEKTISSITRRNRGNRFLPARAGRKVQLP